MGLFTSIGKLSYHRRMEFFFHTVLMFVTYLNSIQIVLETVHRFLKNYADTNSNCNALFQSLYDAVTIDWIHLVRKHLLYFKFGTGQGNQLVLSGMIDLFLASDTINVLGINFVNNVSVFF